MTEREWVENFVSLISLYLGVYIVILQITNLLVPIVISFSIVFVFDSIVIVNRFLFLYLL